MNRADEELLRGEVNAPALRVLFDSKLAASSVRSAGWEVPSLELTYLRFKPKTGATAAFRVLGGEFDGRILTGQTHRDPDKRAKTMEAGNVKSQLAEPGRRGGPDAAWQQDGVVWAWFPSDRRVPGLKSWHRRTSPQALLDHLDLESAEGGVKVLRYKPGRRAVLQVTDRQGVDHLVKAHSRSQFLRIHRAPRFDGGPFEALRQQKTSRKRAAFCYPWVDGKRPASSDDHRFLGEQVAKMHGLAPRPNAPPVPPVAPALLAIAEQVGALAPSLGHRAAAAVAGVLAALPADPQVNLHGDLHADQVLIGDNGLHLLDLDQQGMGPAGLDVGSWWAHLACRQLNGQEAHGNEHANAFLDGYGDVHPAWLAQALFRLILRPFRERSMNWPADMQDILATVEGLVEPAPPGPLVRDSFGALDDPKLSGLQTDARPDVESRLLPQIWVPSMYEPSSSSPRLAQIEVTRHKKGRRALLTYDCVGDGRHVRVLGKIRSRGLDERTMRLQGKLAESLFDAEAPDRVRVPRVLGHLDGGTWLQQHVPGVPLTAHLPGPDAAKLCEQAMAGVGRLHASDIPLPKTHTLTDEMRILDERLGRVARDYPALRERLEATLATCWEVARQLPPVSLAPIHRDFYPAQILVDGQRLWIVDWDLAAMGDPAVDAGNFAAHVLERGLRDTGSIGAYADAARAALRQFEENRGAGARKRADAYVAFSLARHLHICLDRPGRAHNLDAIWAAVDDRLTSLA